MGIVGGRSDGNNNRSKSSSKKNNKRPRNNSEAVLLSGGNLATFLAFLAVPVVAAFLAFNLILKVQTPPEDLVDLVGRELRSISQKAKSHHRETLNQNTSSTKKGDGINLGNYDCHF